MKNSLRKRMKECCAQEYKRLVNQLVLCDEQTVTPAERHACYRVSARVLGRRGRKCIHDAQQIDTIQSAYC